MAENYDVFEIQIGACLEEVEAICKNLTDKGSFSETSVLGLTDVEMMLSATYYEMVAMMAQFFISPEQTDKKILGLLQFYNALGAAAKVELAVATTGYGANESVRHNFLYKQFENGFMRLLASNALSVMGAVLLTDPRGDGLSAGGISISDKTVISSDTDATKYSFTRKAFDSSMTVLAPGGGDVSKELP